MQIEAVNNDIWDRLESGERLTPDQEKVIMAHIKSGDFKDVPAIVNKLRENSQHLQDKSVEEMARVVNNLRKYMMFDLGQPLPLNDPFEKAIVYQWQGAFTNAQANRLENTANQTKDTIEAQRVRDEAMKNAQESIKAAENAQRIAQEKAKAEEQARVQKALAAAKAAQEKEQQKRAEAEAQARARAMQQRAQDEARAQEMQRRLNQNRPPPPPNRVGQGAIDGAKTATTPQRPGSMNDYLNRR